MLAPSSHRSTAVFNYWLIRKIRHYQRLGRRYERCLEVAEKMLNYERKISVQTISRALKIREEKVREVMKEFPEFAAFLHRCARARGKAKSTLYNYGFKGEELRA